LFRSGFVRTALAEGERSENETTLSPLSALRLRFSNVRNVEDDRCELSPRDRPRVVITMPARITSKPAARPAAAYRVFWCYGPAKGDITIIAITRHP